MLKIDSIVESLTTVSACEFPKQYDLNLEVEKLAEYRPI